MVMGQRPLTGYHVYAFTIPLLILHFPYVMGVDWTLAGELRTIATYFVLAVVWDYLWFVLNPAYTVQPLPARQRLVVRGPVDLALPARLLPERRLSIGLAGLAALVDGDASPCAGTCGCWPGWRSSSRSSCCSRRSTTAGTATCAARAPTTAPATPTYPPPAPEEVWSGGVPDLHPLDRDL